MFRYCQNLRFCNWASTGCCRQITTGPSFPSSLLFKRLANTGCTLPETRGSRCCCCRSKRILAFIMCLYKDLNPTKRNKCCVCVIVATRAQLNTKKTHVPTNAACQHKSLVYQQSRPSSMQNDTREAARSNPVRELTRKSC